MPDIGYVLHDWFANPRRQPMKVKEGDVLVCSCKDCETELTITKACCGDTCDHDARCDIQVMCCGESMTIKE